MRAGRAHEPGHSALFNLACASLRSYSLNPYKVLEKAMKEHFNRHYLKLQFHISKKVTV